MDTSKMTNKDITLLMAGRFVDVNRDYFADANRDCLDDPFTSSEIICEIPGALTAKQAYTALVSLCADGYCKKVGPGKFVLTKSGLEHYDELELELDIEDVLAKDDYDDEDEEEVETVEPTWKTAYDAAMKAYNAAMDAYRTAMSSI